MDSKVYEGKTRDERKRRDCLSPPTTTLWPPETESKHVSPEILPPPVTGDHIRALQGTGGGGRGGGASEDGEDEGRASTLMAGVMIFFTRWHKCLPPPYSSSYLLVALALQARHTRPIPHTHTHTHAMVRPPIKSKVVCFYWSFALTSGLSFWRLYLSASSWKFSVDKAQCFQLGENQAPGALAIFPPPPPPEPTFLPSLPLFPPHWLRDPPPLSSLAFHSPPSCRRRRRSVSAANYPHKTKVVAAVASLALGAAGPGPCQH